MNKVFLTGRLTRDPEIKNFSDDKIMARYILAVDRRFKKDREGQKTDFISCVSFGNTAKFLEKYGHRGTKFVVEGRIQTSNYTNEAGNRIYTTDVVVEALEFAESKKHQQDSDDRLEITPSEFIGFPEEFEDENPFI